MVNIKLILKWILNFFSAVGKKMYIKIEEKYTWKKGGSRKGVLKSKIRYSFYWIYLMELDICFLVGVVFIDCKEELGQFGVKSCCT